MEPPNHFPSGSTKAQVYTQDEGLTARGGTAELQQPAVCSLLLSHWEVKPDK